MLDNVKKQRSRKRKRKGTKKGEIQRSIKKSSNAFAFNVDAKKRRKSMAKGTELLQKFKSKLEGSQFRYLNEQMYMKSSDESFQMIQENKSLFDSYHKGFNEQVKVWPVNPVNVIIQDLLRLPKTTRIGDMGCGEARIAQILEPKGFRKVYSFDLARPNKHVTVCNIKRVPLEDRSLDIVVFCLALMGTDFYDFLLEANRILRNNGTLIIAEVKSRFIQSNTRKAMESSHESTSALEMKKGIDLFTKLLQHCGFECMKKEISNQMFAMFNFRKIKEIRVIPKSIHSIFSFKPCMYKRR